MLDKDKEKRLRAVKIANAINSIEGVPLSDKVKQISERWANGEITSEQIHKIALVAYTEEHCFKVNSTDLIFLKSIPFVKELIL